MFAPRLPMGGKPTFLQRFVPFVRNVFYDTFTRTTTAPTIGTSETGNTYDYRPTSKTYECAGWFLARKGAGATENSVIYTECEASDGVFDGVTVYMGYQHGVTFRVQHGVGGCVVLNYTNGTTTTRTIGLGTFTIHATTGAVTYSAVQAWTLVSAFQPGQYGGGHGTSKCKLRVDFSGSTVNIYGQGTDALGAWSGSWTLIGTRNSFVSYQTQTRHGLWYTHDYPTAGTFGGGQAKYELFDEWTFTKG